MHCEVTRWLTDDRRTKQPSRLIFWVSKTWVGDLSDLTSFSRSQNLLLGPLLIKESVVFSFWLTREVYQSVTMSRPYLGCAGTVVTTCSLLWTGVSPSSSVGAAARRAGRSERPLLVPPVRPRPHSAKTTTLRTVTTVCRSLLNFG